MSVIVVAGPLLVAFDVVDASLVCFGDVGQAVHGLACLGKDAENFVDLAVCLAVTFLGALFVVFDHASCNFEVHGDCVDSLVCGHWSLVPFAWLVSV
jgi:hypothetical protein